MAKFYSIILPSTDASPETMYFFQKQCCFHWRPCHTTAQRRKWPCPLQQASFRLKAHTQRQVGPCELLSLWHIWLMFMGDWFVHVWKPTFASAFVVQAPLRTTFVYFGDAKTFSKQRFYREKSSACFGGEGERGRGRISLWFLRFCMPERDLLRARPLHLLSLRCCFLWCDMGSLTLLLFWQKPWHPAQNSLRSAVEMLHVYLGL